MATHRLVRVAVAALLLSVGVPAAGVRGDDAKDDAKGGGPRTYALLIGCTEYPELRKQCASEEVYRSKVLLGGCVNDVEAMTTTLVDRLAVPRANIVTLAGWPADEAARPTLANVRAALVALAARTYRKGDRVIVHYSGHGVQQPDDDGDETDGLDEAWLVADGRKEPATAYAGTLRDDEIGRLLRAIRDRGASVWCVMDCCHSATGMRGAADGATRTRGLSPATMGVELVPAAPRGAARGRQDSPMDDTGEGVDGIVVFYAAQSFQEVPEVRVPERGAASKPFGLLTSALVGALQRCGDDATFEGLYEQVVAGYRGMGKHHVVQPLAEGDLRPRLSGGPAGLSPTLFVRKIGGALELSGGALSGLAEGTELDVYPPAGAGEGVQPLGRVVLTDLRAESSVVRAVRGSDTAWAKGATGAWPAKVAKYVVGETALPLTAVDEAERPVAFEALPEQVRGVLDDASMKARFPWEADPARAKWVVVVGAGREPIALAPALRARAAPRFEVDAGSLEEKLLTIYRGENLLKLCARDPDGGRLPGNLELEVWLRDAKGGRTKVRPGQVVRPGSTLELELIKEEKRSRTDVESMDVFVFWIDPHFGIWMLRPDKDGGARLSLADVTKEGRRIRVGQEALGATTDEGQGEERIVVFASPAGKDELHLEFLTQPALRARGAEPEPRDGVAELLDDLDPRAAGTRGIGKSVDRKATRLYTKVFTFETRWNGLHAPPASEEQPSSRIVRPPTAPAPGAPPDAWNFGPDVRLARAAGEEPWCLLVAREDGPMGATNVLVDLDDRGPPLPGTKAGLEKVVGDRSFDAELAIRIEPATRRVFVWYDTDDDGTFDEVQIDADDDLRAEERFRRGDGRWTREVGIDTPLLSTSRLRWIADDESRAAIVRRLRAVAGD